MHSSKNNLHYLSGRSKTEKGLSTQTPGLVSGLFHILSWPHMLLFLSRLSHSFNDSSSCQCLPCPITGHWLWASWPLSSPVLQLLQTSFPAKLFFFPFQWLNRDQEAVRYAEALLAKERRECPGELSMPITSDYLQFYPEDSEKKQKKKHFKRHTTSCLFRVKQACQCFILRAFQQDSLLIRIWPNVEVQIQFSDCSVHTCVWH